MLFKNIYISPTEWISPMFNCGRPDIKKMICKKLNISDDIHTQFNLVLISKNACIEESEIDIDTQNYFNAYRCSKVVSLHEFEQLNTHLIIALYAFKSKNCIYTEFTLSTFSAILDAFNKTDIGNLAIDTACSNIDYKSKYHDTETAKLESEEDYAFIIDSETAEDTESNDTNQKELDTPVKNRKTFI